MRILVLVTDAFGGHGGIALYNRDMLMALSNHPAKPEIIVIPRIIKNPIEILPERLTYLTSAKNSRIKFVITFMRAVINNRNFDVVICGHLNLLPFAEFTRRLHCAKLILFVYGMEAWTSRRGKVTNFLISKIDALISIRKYTTQRLEQWASINKVTKYTLENAIHIDQYGQGPKKKELLQRYNLEGKKVLLTLGRVDEKNCGVDEVINVFPELKKKIQNLVYVIAGTGKHLNAIKRKVQELGIEDSIVFTGMIEEAEKVDHYRLADAFVMAGSDPDHFDRYPIRFSFLEAMACGIPIISSTPEDINDSSYAGVPNINVDPNNKDSLITGIIRGLDVGPGEIPKIIENLSFEKFSYRLHSIINDVCQLKNRH